MSAAAQTFEDFSVGSSSATDTYRTADDMWHIQSLDDGVIVSMDKGGVLLSFVGSSYGIIWIHAACGYNETTRTVDERAALMAAAQPPVMIPQGTRVHFECPPNKYAHMDRVHP